MDGGIEGEEQGGECGGLCVRGRLQDEFAGFLGRKWLANP